MKLIFSQILIFIALFLSTNLFSQNCQFGTAEDSIFTNQIKIVASTSSLVNISNDNYSNIWLNRWVGGRDVTWNLNLAVSMYTTQNKNDFYPGPLDENGETNQNNCSNWDRVFKIYQSDIEELKYLFENENLTIDNIPKRIKYWPGKSNPYLYSDYNISTHSIYAKFIDVDNDNVYDPLKGDYPILYGADEMMFWLINDNGGPHTLSYGMPIQITIGRYAYLYNSNSNQTINRTVFFKDVHYNFSPLILENYYNCIFVDYDSPDYKHDKFGTIPEKNAIYMFNQCGFQPCDFTEDTVRNEIVTMKILHTNYLDSLNNNLGLTSTMFNNSARFSTMTPDNASEFYKYMQSIWKDEVPLTYGNLGYNLNNDNEVKFAFNDLQSDTTKWTICDNSVFIGDLKTYLGIGPSTSYPGQIKTVDYAISFFNIDDYPCENIDKLKNNLDNIQDFYDSGMVNDLQHISISNQFAIYPNPNRGIFKIVGKFTKNTNAKIIDINGNVLKKLEIPRNTTEYDINLSDFQTGIYFISLINNESFGFEKIIIQ